jgi:hypothetical protein
LNSARTAGEQDTGKDTVPKRSSLTALEELGPAKAPAAAVSDSAAIQTSSFIARLY